MKMDRRVVKQTLMERKRLFGLLGMKMDRYGKKEIIRMEKKRDFILSGMKMDGRS